MIDFGKDQDPQIVRKIDNAFSELVDALSLITQEREATNPKSHVPLTVT